MIGDEGHVLDVCPQFEQERRELWNKIGCVYQDCAWIGCCVVARVFKDSTEAHKARITELDTNIRSKMDVNRELEHKTLSDVIGCKISALPTPLAGA